MWSEQKHFSKEVYKEIKNKILKKIKAMKMIDSLKSPANRAQSSRKRSTKTFFGMVWVSLMQLIDSNSHRSRYSVSRSRILVWWNSTKRGQGNDYGHPGAAKSRISNHTCQDFLIHQRQIQIHCLDTGSQKTTPQCGYIVETGD